MLSICKTLKERVSCNLHWLPVLFLRIILRNFIFSERRVSHSCVLLIFKLYISYDYTIAYMFVALCSLSSVSLATTVLSIIPYPSHVCFLIGWSFFPVISFNGSNVSGQFRPINASITSDGISCFSSLHWPRRFWLLYILVLQIYLPPQPM